MGDNGLVRHAALDLQLSYIFSSFFLINLNWNDVGCYNCIPSTLMNVKINGGALPPSWRVFV